MPIRPIDAGEVPEEEIKKLEEGQVPPETGSEPSKETPAPKVEEKPQPEGGELKVPYHQDPQVQLYIERQVTKRLEEGSQGVMDRLTKLEKMLSDAGKKGPITIGGWTPANEAETRAARAIILQAKRELLEELSTVDRESREAETKSDRDFSDWLGELRTTGTLKNDDDEMEFARLIVEYKLEDRQAAVNLWGRLQTEVEKAKGEGREAGAREAGEAKVGSARKGGEPGTARSYQARRLEEPTMDSIVEREMNRMGY